MAKKPVPAKPTAPTRGATRPAARPAEPALTEAQRRQAAQNAAARNFARRTATPASPAENAKTVGSAVRRLLTLADIGKAVDSAAAKR